MRDGTACAEGASEALNDADAGAGQPALIIRAAIDALRGASLDAVPVYQRLDLRIRLAVIQVNFTTHRLCYVIAFYGERRLEFEKPSVEGIKFDIGAISTFGYFISSLRIFMSNAPKLPIFWHMMTLLMSDLS
ncbi:MAG: hypothetical protein LCH99_29885 [Proteobacteria bacterium]|nr:hypothetical protein [Pseudomonadota bacterium]